MKLTSYRFFDIFRSPAVRNLLAGAVLISFSAQIVKIVQVGPFYLGFYRTFLGGVALLVYVLVMERKQFPPHPSLSPFGRGILFAALAGVFFAVDLSFWHYSIYFIGPGLATVVGNFQVFFLALYGIFFLREKAEPRLLISIILAMAGIFFICGFEWTALTPAFRKGIIFGIITALCYTGFILSLRSSQKSEKRLSPAANMAVICFVCALIMGPEGYIAGESFLLPDAGTFFLLLLYGIVCQGVAWVLISKALPVIEVSKAGIILLAQPALSMVWDIIFFRQGITALEITGVLLSLAGIYLVSLKKK